MSHAFDSKALALSRQVMGLIETPMHEAQLQAKIQNLFIDAMKFAAPAVQAEQLSGNAEQVTKCWCHTCRPVTMTDMRFVVCPECGNKRCPHANDHRNVCTGSNEPGQEGSAYPDAPQQEAE
ncbi:hypothetical protein [Atlantibacter hermannii]|uniref:hypothetical protein n=1 Tax=Atlantibacter hermannii TaxID=565 RepID=UPI0025512122|nr:hypothetical protein [Atlantibacter hermannii]